jgi:hypothetical protein
MQATIENDVRRDIGGDQQRIDRLDTQVGKLTFKHVLLPVWLAAFRYGGKSYRFVVNGRTGAVQGERPYSRAKIALAVLLAFLLALGFAALLVLPELEASFGGAPGGGAIGWSPPAGGQAGGQVIVIGPGGGAVQWERPGWYATGSVGADGATPDAVEAAAPPP